MQGIKKQMSLIRGTSAAALPALGLLLAVALVSSAPQSEAASNAAVTNLHQQPCPELAVVRNRTYTKRQIDLALRGRYIVAGDRVKLKPKVNWFKNHGSSRDFQEQLHSFRWMDVLFLAYLAGDRRAILQARRLAVDWVKQNPLKQRKGKGKGKGRKPKPVPRMAWQNLVSGDRAPYLGYLTRAAACEGLLPRKPAKVLLDSLVEHGDYLAHGKGYYHSNHGLFADLGLFLLADRYVPFLAQAPGWEGLARDRFPRTLAGRMSGSGVWLEHSPDYQLLAIRMAETFIRFAGEDPRTGALLSRLKDTAAWFITPDGKLPLIGDTSASRAPKELRKASRKLNGYRTFMDAGYFAVNRKKRYFAVTSAFHNGSHKHSDELGFELHDQGTRVITGPGKYGFERDKWRNYVLSNAAHSTLTVDGKAWPRDAKHSYGSGIIASGIGGSGWFAALARNPLTQRQGVYHRRLFVYHPLVGLFVHDTVDSQSGRHKYRRYLQFGPDVEVRRENKRGLALDAKGSFEGCLRDERSPDLATKLRLNRGSRNPLQGFTFPKPGNRVKRWTATMRSKARDMEHLFGIGLQRGCPFSVERVPGSGILDFVLRRHGHETLRISVSQADSVLHVTETELPG